MNVRLEEYLADLHRNLNQKENERVSWRNIAIIEAFCVAVSLVALCVVAL